MGIIEKPAVLQPRFVPKDVPHRDSEVNFLTNVLSPVLTNREAPPCLITGSTGVGKTSVSRYVLRRLKREVGDVRAAYVNCWSNYNPIDALYAVLQDLGMGADFHRQSTAQSVALYRLRDCSSPIVLILDEADQLSDKSLLYDLYELPQVSQILITQSEQSLFASVDSRLRSRLGGAKRIEFERYTLTELADILQARADAGLVSQAIRRTEIETISDLAAGDARLGIEILRVAAQDAEQDGSRRITTDNIRNSESYARQEIKRRNLDSLRPIQRTLFTVVHELSVDGEEDVVRPDSLYREYRARASDPKTDRTVRRHLRKLAHYNLVEISGTSKDRVYSISENAPSPINSTV